MVSGLFADSVRYNSMQKFIERVRPEVSIVQLDNTGALLDYYGGDELIQSNMLNEFDTIPLVSPSGDYLFGRPVFQQGKPSCCICREHEGSERSRAFKDLRG